MNILLTNDDGIHAAGLRALCRIFSQKHRVMVVAPDRERSAVGHGITLHTPLRAEKVRLTEVEWGYAVSGTPADCIKLGLLSLLEIRPDMVISGINPGANVGVNVNYSGTVAAAREAALYGIPAISVSINSHAPDYYDEAARFALDLAENYGGRTLPHGTILNVNVPDLPLNAVAGIRISRIGTRLPPEYTDKKTDPRNRPYYWHGLSHSTVYEDPEFDEAAVNQNFISVSPIKCDLTDYDLLDHIESWGLMTGDGEDSE